MRRFRYGAILSERPAVTAGDAVIVLGLAAILYAGARLAFHAPKVIAGPAISLSPWVLPWYATLSAARMGAAYILGYAAFYNRTARAVLMPALDVLQSVPNLSFLPRRRRSQPSRRRSSSSSPPRRET